MTSKILVTGGCGFIGSNFLKIMVPKYKQTKFLNIDKLTYAGKYENVIKINHFKNYSFLKLDICNYTKLQKVIKKFKPGIVVHFAAESHVDNSIKSPGEFMKSNILGTYNILRSINKNVFLIHISTDEVYGDILNGRSSENYPYQPSSPYAASKAASDHLVSSYIRTYNLSAIVTNCSNNYGPKQHPEKLIPKLIYNILNNKPLPLYGKGTNSREWIYVKDHCEALFKVFQKGKIGEFYNIGSNKNLNNLQVCNKLIKVSKKISPIGDKVKINFVKDRPGHDTRYALNSNKIIKKLKWKPKMNFEKGIKVTFNWYNDNKKYYSTLSQKDILNRLGNND